MLLECLLGLALLAPPQDSVRVSASLSSPRTTTGSTAVLLVSVETGGATPDEIPLPVLSPGLDLGPVSDFSQLQVAFPGGRTRVTRREIVLIAREPGEYRIPSIPIRVSGRMYATSALTLTVTGSAAGAPPAASDDVRLRAWLDPDTVYLGEQVLYQAEALLPEDLRLRQARAPDFMPPATTGLWVYDVPDAVTVSLRIIGGAAFEVQSFRQVFFPLTIGTMEVPAARMRYEVRRGFAFTPDRREVASPPATLVVRPLPAGAPAGFSGAVGSYTLSAELSAASVAAGEPITLRVTVEGVGNVKGLPRPELPELEDVDVFTGEERSESGFADGRVTGRKVMEWTLVPHGRGQLAIPAVQYAWFDPDRAEYRTAETAPLSVPVLPRRGGSGADTALAPLRSESSPAPFQWVRTPAFAALQLLPPLLLAAFWLRRSRRTRPAPPQRGPATLERATALLADPRACLEELARQLRAHDTAAARAVLEQVRALRYAPVPATRADCERLIAAARAALHEGTKLRVVALPVVFAALAIVQSHDGSAFQRGVTAYGAADYDVAVAQWLAEVRAQPHDAAAWYNLGHAWERQGERGRAVWAWLQALELRPRDRWTRHNLRFSGAAHALEDFAPRVPLNTEEAILIAALLWWGAWGTFAAAWLRARPRVAWLGLAALLLMVPLLALVASRAARADRGVSVQPVVLRNAPARPADTIAEIEPGEPLVILRERGDWLLARSYDLREGWVERSTVGRL